MAVLQFFESWFSKGCMGINFWKWNTQIFGFSGQIDLGGQKLFGESLQYYQRSNQKSIISGVIRFWNLHFRDQVWVIQLLGHTENIEAEGQRPQDEIYA